VIYVKEGIYDEQVTITKKMQNVTMYGDGSPKTIITGNKNFRDGVRTFLTASFGMHERPSPCYVLLLLQMSKFNFFWYMHVQWWREMDS